MEIILDTNALSALADGNIDLAVKLDAVKKLFIPVIVMGEYRYGISMSKYRRNYENWLDGIVEDITILPILDSTSEFYSAICRKLKKAGTPIPTNDIWIAALALEHHLPIISRDQHLKKIDKLTVVPF